MRGLIIALVVACALALSPPDALAQTATGGSAVSTATTTPSVTATTPTATATTPTTTSPPATTAPPAATTAPPAATTAPGQGSSSGGSRAPVGLIVLGALLVAALIAWGLARWWAWEPRWLVRWRHATGEAGWRASNAWAEFTDWLRLGR